MLRFVGPCDFNRTILARIVHVTLFAITIILLAGCTAEVCSRAQRHRRFTAYAHPRPQRHTYTLACAAHCYDHTKPCAKRHTHAYPDRDSGGDMPGGWKQLCHNAHYTRDDPFREN